MTGADASKRRILLFFDVFGTCVAQRPAIADELHEATKSALDLKSSHINNNIRGKAASQSYDQWFKFGGTLNADVDKYVKTSISETDNVNWREVDAYRLKSFHRLLSQQGLIIPDNQSNSPLAVKEGSLWNESTIEHLGRVWHRLPPWKDTCAGLELLNTKFETVTLSNTYNNLMKSLVSHSSIPFKHVFTSDLFDSYKPDPKVYLGAAKRLGVKPEQCGLVASHLFDLKGAKACGFYTIYTERPLEEKNPALRDENIPDFWIKESENGFFDVARHFGIERK